jgi:hypothetical protein
MSWFKPRPKKGDTWAFYHTRKNPWDDNPPAYVYVKDVKEGWVCYTNSLESVEKPCSQYEDYFMRTANFRDIFSLVKEREDDRQ